MKTINILAVLEDARPVSTQASTWVQAAEIAIAWNHNPSITYHGKCPVIAVYLSLNGGRAERHTVESLIRDLQSGEIRRADERDAVAFEALRRAVLSGIPGKGLAPFTTALKPTSRLRKSRGRVRGNDGGFPLNWTDSRERR